MPESAQRHTGIATNCKNTGIDCDFQAIAINTSAGLSIFMAARQVNLASATQAYGITIFKKHRYALLI